MSCPNEPCVCLVMLGLHRQNPDSTAATVNANLSKVFAACWIQISPEKNAPPPHHQKKKPKTKQWWERSFMVTELFIKSPVPGIDGEWGRWTKEGDGGREGMARHRVVMSPESCINGHKMSKEEYGSSGQVRSWWEQQRHPQAWPCCPFQNVFSRLTVI